MRPAAFVSSVVTPAQSYNLTDLATVKTLFNITGTASDAFLNLLIPRASTAVQTYCSNKFVVETLLDQFWPGDDGWPWAVQSLTAPLQLKRYPLVSIASVVETIAGVATTLTQGTDFVVDFARAQLTRLDTYAGASSPAKQTFWRADPIAVQYNAGFSPLPTDVSEAVEIVVKARYYAQNRDPLIRSQDMSGVFAQTYWFATGPGGEGDLPIDAQAKLSRYRDPVFA